MAPKPSSPATKQLLILNHIRTSCTAHTLKELEKSLPGATSVPSIQIKDHIQALCDESLLRVEKIGTGNWYWSFLSEEKRIRDKEMKMLEEEKMKLDGCVAELEEKLRRVEMERRREAEEEEEEEENEDGERGERGEGEGEGLMMMIRREKDLREELEQLRRELMGYRDGDPVEVVKKKREVEVCKERAERWTDNIGVLEGWLKGVLGGDRERMEGIRKMFYGDEYVEGEGLSDL